MRTRRRVDTLFRSHVRALTPSRPWQYATYALTLIPINKSDTQVYVIRDPIGTRFGGAAFHIGHNITCQSKVTIVCVLISLPDDQFPLLFASSPRVLPARLFECSIISRVLRRLVSVSCETLPNRSVCQEDFGGYFTLESVHRCQICVDFLVFFSKPCKVN